MRNINSEQHSANFTWFINGGGYYGVPGRWDAIVAGEHVATFFKRSDARNFMRSKKSAPDGSKAE